MIRGGVLIKLNAKQSEFDKNQDLVPKIVLPKFRGDSPSMPVLRSVPE